jgi:hypothetical protein
LAGPGRFPELVTDHQLRAQGLEDTPESTHIRRVPAILDARDRRLAGTDPPGELSLRETEDRASVDYQLGDPVVLADARAFCSVGSTSRRTPRRGSACRASDRAGVLGHGRDHIIFDNHVQGPARRRGGAS